MLLLTGGSGASRNNSHGYRPSEMPMNKTKSLFPWALIAVAIIFGALVAFRTGWPALKLVNAQYQTSRVSWLSWYSFRC